MSEEIEEDFSYEDDYEPQVRVANQPIELYCNFCETSMQFLRPGDEYKLPESGMCHCVIGCCAVSDANGLPHKQHVSNRPRPEDYYVLNDTQLLRYRHYRNKGMDEQTAISIVVRSLSLVDQWVFDGATRIDFHESEIRYYGESF